jgi:hypothetical protein
VRAARLLGSHFAMDVVSERAANGLRESHQTSAEGAARLISYFAAHIFNTLVKSQI